jgi:hypothetical protein
VPTSGYSRESSPSTASTPATSQLPRRAVARGRGTPRCQAHRMPGPGAVWPTAQIRSGIIRAMFYCPALAIGRDISNDGYPDLLALRRSDGSLWLWAGNPAGGFGSLTQAGIGWQVMDAVVLPGDRDGEWISWPAIKRIDVPLSQQRSWPVQDSDQDRPGFGSIRSPGCETGLASVTHRCQCCIRRSLGGGSWCSDDQRECSWCCTARRRRAWMRR